MSCPLGCCLCGAGGGGFLAAITNKPDMYSAIQQVISTNSVSNTNIRFLVSVKIYAFQEFDDFVLYKAEVDADGITVS